MHADSILERIHNSGDLGFGADYSIFMFDLRPVSNLIFGSLFPYTSPEIKMDRMV